MMNVKVKDIIKDYAHCSCASPDAYIDFLNCTRRETSAIGEKLMSGIMKSIYLIAPSLLQTTGSCFGNVLLQVFPFFSNSFKFFNKICYHCVLLLPIEVLLV